jgi:hypothetical protein
VRRSLGCPRALDLHVLSAPPAFVLSQDQTLQSIFGVEIPPSRAKRDGFADFFDLLDAVLADCGSARRFLTRCFVFKDRISCPPDISAAFLVRLTSLSILPRLVNFFFRPRPVVQGRFCEGAAFTFTASALSTTFQLSCRSRRRDHLKETMTASLLAVSSEGPPAVVHPARGRLLREHGRAVKRTLLEIDPLPSRWCPITGAPHGRRSQAPDRYSPKTSLKASAISPSVASRRTASTMGGIRFCVPLAVSRTKSTARRAASPFRRCL